MRRRTRIPLVGVAIAAVSALAVQGFTLSNASWNDGEWAHSAVGTVLCTNAAGKFASRGEGRVLSGSLPALDLDSAVAARGVRVTHDGQNVHVTPSGLPASGTEAYADPLSVTALNALGANLTGVLQLPLGAPAGVLAQYAEAHSDGTSAGAAGYLNSSGGINLDGAPGGYPALATLSLSSVLGSLDHQLGTLLPGIADVSLTAGAVAGRARNDGCAAAWASNPRIALTREYLASSLRLGITSPRVGDLVTAVQGRVAQLRDAVNGLAGNASVTTAIKNGATTLVNNVLGVGGLLGVSLGSVTVTALTATLNTSAVDTLLTQSFGDSGGVLTIDPTTGRITVDTVALLQQAYPAQYAQGLNGLPPNTDLLADPAIATKLSAALTAALDDWIARLNTALTQAIDALSLTAKVEINLQLKTCVPLTGICTTAPLAMITTTTTGTLLSLTTTAELALLGLPPIPAVSALLSNVVSSLTSGMGAVVRDAVSAALTVFRALPAAVTGLAAPIVTAVSGLYAALFLSGVVAVTANAQNDPLTGSAGPPDWAALTPRRYDVAALRIGVLDAAHALGTVLYLGRGSVGPSCSLSAAAAGACSGY